jgi:hypothetical protein
LLVGQLIHVLAVGQHTNDGRQDLFGRRIVIVVDCIARLVSGALFAAVRLKQIVIARIEAIRLQKNDESAAIQLTGGHPLGVAQNITLHTICMS